MAGSTFKTMMNSLSHHSDILRELTIEENESLKKCLAQMLQDVNDVCKKYELTLMLGGGSALGCVRHQGFIPWDDDLDVMMLRKDYEKLKEVFEKELGDKYILSAPNTKEKSKARFPKILKKNTTLKELTDLKSDLPSGVFLDIFLIENIPQNKFWRKIKGIWCNVLMFASTQAYAFENRSECLKKYMCQTRKGKTSYRIRMVLGWLCSIIPSWKWFNAVDCAIQHKKETKILGMPTGRKHYFGEIHSKDVLLPVSYGLFCNKTVHLPGKCDIYLRTLYGEHYMQLPPEDKRERHFIVEFDLNK